MCIEFAYQLIFVSVYVAGRCLIIGMVALATTLFRKVRRRRQCQQKYKPATPVY